MITHDEMIERMFMEYQRADRKKYVDLFISGLSKHKIFLGMAALGYMNSFPKHKYSILKDWVLHNGQKSILKQRELKVLDRTVLYFEELPDDMKPKVIKTFHNGVSYPCEICSGYYNEEYPFDDETKEFWLEHGSLHCSSHLFYFWMEYTNSIQEISEPTQEDFSILQVILNCICAAEENEGIRDVLKKIKKQQFYRTWYSDIRNQKKANNESTEFLSTFVEYRIQLILELFGFCGILHTDHHVAPFYEYNNLPMMSGSSARTNWELPVDFWRGKDGIDYKAFIYWFGSQPYKFNI